MGKLAGSDESTIISVRLDEKSKEKYKESLPDGTSMSEDIRKYIKRKKAVADGSEPPDETLAKAYRILEQYTDETNQIQTEAAKSLLAEKLKTPKSVVKETILYPLEEGDYIEPKWGKMIVRPREYS